ncbi:MAG TPA: phage tail tip lysozyme [Polyangiaceae bacterium]
MRFVVLSLFGAATIAACSAPNLDPASARAEALSTAFANDKTAYDYFIGKGLTNFQAAAIVGNLDQESGVDPTISQSGGGVGRGIAQWSTGGRWDTAPNDNLKDFATQEGKPMTSLDAQLDFIWYELTMFPDYGLAKLQATSNVTDATGVVEDNFEGCVYAQYPECNLPQRVTYAMDVLNAYGNDPAPSGGAGGGAGSNAAGNGGGNVAGNSGSAGVGGSNSGGNGTSAGSGGALTGSSGSASGGSSSSSAGSNNTAGSANAASGSSATSSSDSSNGSSCALSTSSSTHRTSDVSFAFGLAAAMLGLRARRRQSRSATR